MTTILLLTSEGPEGSLAKRVPIVNGKHPRNAGRERLTEVLGEK